MSDSPTPSAPPAPPVSTPGGPPSHGAPVAAAKPLPTEIKVMAHSSLFYWWPIWFFGFLFALWTYADNYRMAIVGHDSEVVITPNPVGGTENVTIKVVGDSSRLRADSVEKNGDKDLRVPHIRVSPRTWMGPVFFVILFLVILITNIPLRGLWSLITIIMIAFSALLLTLFAKWDLLLKSSGDLHVYINMAGYLAIATALFGAWLIAILIFDRRTYIVFMPGQIKVCEEIGGREKVFDTTNLTLEKRRDDWFRHIILGFGTGDLTVKTAGTDRHEILLPNVAFIAFKIDAIEQMLRTRPTSA